MPYNIKPFMDLDEANEFLEGLGVHGATKKPHDGTLRLYARRRKWVDPNTGAVSYYYPEEQMTTEIKAHLESIGWRVERYLSSQWVWIWRG